MKGGRTTTTQKQTKPPKPSDFDWQNFTSEKYAQIGVRDVSRILRLDHVGWIKHFTVDRLQSRPQAEASWWNAIANTAKYPGRDHEGSGECLETFGCVRAECAGGKGACEEVD